MCYGLYGNTFLINTKKKQSGDEESVCRPEQENLEEQARQDNKKQT